MANSLGGAIVSGLVELILDKLGTPAFQEIGRLIGVKDELKRLGDTLSTIDAVLLDAKEQQITLRSVRSWLETLKDVAYDIEDVLDLVSTQDLELKVSGRSLSQKVSTLSLPYKFARKIKAICHRLDEIATNRRNYNFQERHQALAPTLGTISQERETCSFVQESRVFGREEDKERVVTRLVSFPSQEVIGTSVLPIVGIGGMGKTTLAKLVFNDPRIRAIENFELKLWAYVPNKFDLKTVMCNIIQSITGEGSSFGLNVEAIKNRLHQILIARTYFLVLDNVWIEDSNEWLELKELLDVGSKRSRIVVTTREDRVASIVGTMEEYKLKPLSDDHIWSIFVHSAFREGEEEAYPSLVQIGKSIVRKCRGVPLAAKTMGSQLRTVRDDSTWRMIKESELWKINQSPNDVLPALRLSFYQLPYHLRSCFSVCSTTVKGEYISRESMILRWMALGLLESKEVNGTLEEVGNRYFEELRARSFFEVVNPFSVMVRHLAMHSNMSEAVVGIKLSGMAERALSYGRTYGMVNDVQMHDLIHDLATYVTGEETCVVSCDDHDVSTRARFILWKAKEDLLERDQFPKELLAAKKARSLVLRPHKISCMSKSFLCNLLSRFRCLRILALDGFAFEALPSSMGDLKHLRLLSLSHNNKLKGLPESISNLVNLQTLNVYLCFQLERLPKEIYKLFSLRHLVFTSKLVTFMESALHGWTSMQIIKICDCKTLASLPEEIGTLTTLRFLEINRCPNLVSLPSSIDQLSSLETLRIFGCERLDLAGWEGLHGLRSLIQLNIQQLPLLVHFPDGLQHVCGSLKYLIVKLCRNLVALPECLEQCTSLVKLTLYKCPSLCTLPEGIRGAKSLRELWIAYCPELSPRCERERGECWRLISHIPIIQVDNCFIQKKGSHTL